MPLSAYGTNTPTDLALGPAIIRVGTTNLGVTRGGPRIASGFDIMALDFDGKHGDVKGLHRKFYGNASMEFSLLELGHAATGNQIAKLEAGASAASAGTPNITTITPKDGGTLYASGDYLTDVRCIWERGVGTGDYLYLCLHFPCAIVMPWSASDNPRDVATFDWRIQSVKDMASGTVNDATHFWEFRGALPS